MRLTQDGVNPEPGTGDDCPRWDGQPEKRVQLDWVGPVSSEQLVPESQCGGGLTVLSTMYRERDVPRCEWG